MSVDVLLGLQWGDEGKGKVVDFLANNYDIVARFQGGPNAGHTLYVNGQKIVLHHIPSGIFHQRPLNLIGNGVVIDPVSFQKEIEKVKQAGANVAQKLFISRKAHLILPTHKLLDAASEAAKGKDKIGSTLRGIGPTYMDKIGRNGLRVGDVELGKFEQYYKELVKKHEGLLNHLYQYEYDLPALETEFFESIELLRSMQLVDGEYFIYNALKQGKKILAEGAQGSMLDIDFGTYPFVTSSNTITAGVCSGLGIAPSAIGQVIGITKAYCTRVGSGPFPTELLNETGEQIRQAGGEFGATTGRPRRCGWIDLPALRYAVMLNGVTQLVMTKADVLSAIPQIAACVAYEVNGSETPNLPYDLDRQPVEPVLKQFECWQQDLAHCTGYDNLPASLQNYIAFIEQYLGVPVTIVSVGPG
ncbi:adenylosuccinate synthase, partial [Sphingobacteriales bacterium UPWRP_1]